MIRAFSQTSLALAAALALCAIGRGGKEKSAQGPERQSLAEYDLAVDLFHEGRAREALDRSREAVELDEDNAKAA
jgi:Tfp pilus assembly protein PilF